MKSLRIALLKRRAKRLYTQYRSLSDTYECGHYLSDHIDGGRRVRLASRFNKVLNRLEQLGKHVPGERLV